MIRILRKYYLLLAALTCSLVFIAFYYQTYSTNYAAGMAQFQAHFSDLEAQLDKTLDFKAEQIRSEGIRPQWERVEEDQAIALHVYRNDSLLFWSTNLLPIIRFSDIHYPSTGVVHLQNGWYFAQKRTIGDYVLCASFLVRQEYAYKNDALVSDFQSDLHLPFTGVISLDVNKGFAVKDKNGQYIFSIVPDAQQEVTGTESVLLLLFLLTALSLWLYLLFNFRKKLEGFWSWMLLFGIVAVRILSLYGNWFSFMEGTEAYDPSLYATNIWLPNFLEYLLNCIVLVYVLNDLSLRLVDLRKKSWGKWATLLVYVASFFFWLLLLFFIRGIIENSSIPLVIDKLFSLNVYSLLAVTSFGFLFYAYYGFMTKLLQTAKSFEVSGAQLAVATFFIGCLFFLYEITAGNQLFLASLFPLIFCEALLFIVYRQKKTHQLGIGILMLMLFSVVMATSLDALNERKERGERELYANHLAMEKNIVTEVEYLGLAPRIKSDMYLHRLLDAPEPISISDFENSLESRLFHGFWERYEMKFYLFNAAHEALTDETKTNTELYDELQGIVKRSGSASEIDTNIFLIHDHTKYYSYMIRQEIMTKDSTRGTLFCTLRSKQIPEEIGFPRLLISSDANVLEQLESYSIAKYHNGRLATRYGSFNYPSARNVMAPAVVEGKGFFDYREFNHFMLNRNEKDTIVLSVRNRTLVDMVTSFSYLFSFFGLLMMPLLFRVNAENSLGQRLSLSMKIQAGLISLVFLSLLTFGWGSGLFVSTQHHQFTNDMIREKLNSVETEIATKLGHFDELKINENGNYMQGILQKFARVFFTDINLYDNEGFLLATSRPKVFNVGLLSEQMNPESFKYMELYKQSEFVHQESIGKLNFSSAYKPFYNTKDVQMGYINLQHFGQQREFENQIQRFLVAIINVFILLLAVSVILAIFISNWLTAPLRILQESFASVKFGKYNEHIHYDKDDEIGSLVKDYNQKLDELEFAAQQLARNEREMAWREMAKQVAHEIKNPLTPMKLSVQQLMRVYDPSDPKSADKLKAVSNSIIEQIDALTRIANEFSTFAKMPNPNEERVNVLALILGVKEVFQGQIVMDIEADEEDVWIVADKDQFVRVFNNLIKNAIQAIPKEREGHIQVRIQAVGDRVKIELQDNGSGIPKAQHSKIFVPYFTTKGTGTGLGLAMVKQIVENHRGSIDFDSVSDEGTTFLIDLPKA